MRDRLIRLSRLQVQHGRVVVQRRVAWIETQPRLGADQILRRHLLPERTIERRQIAFIAGLHLDPQIAHLVRRPLAPLHVDGRPFRVARIPVGVVVDVSHRQRRAARHLHRRGEAVDVLPAEVPVADVNQLARSSVGQLHLAHDVAGAVVRVRLQRLDLHVHRHDVGVRDHVRRVAGGDVDVLPAEPQHRRRLRRRRVIEV